MLFIMLMINSVLCVYYQQNGETPLLVAVTGEEASIVKFLINKCKVDIAQLDLVRLFAM